MGERLWYAIHGYDIQASASGRNMFGHGRVLPPGSRKIEYARDCSRLLLVKAARRMRRENFYAGRLWLWLNKGSGIASVARRSTEARSRDGTAPGSGRV